MKSPKILILGGGTGGISVAARLARLSPRPILTILEPSAKHYYQPLWTLVAAGVVPPEKTAREERKYIPRGTDWIQERALEIHPSENLVKSESGRNLEYDFLVVAPGIQVNVDAIPGLPQAMGHDGVGSIYLYEQAPKVWRMLQEFRGGRALFTQPATPYKCPGASQKIMYLAESFFRKSGIRHKATITYLTPRKEIFGVPAFVPPILKVIQRKGIAVQYSQELVRVDGDQRRAYLKVSRPDGTVVEEIQDYDFLHVTPPMSAPDFIRKSPLAIAEGPLQGWLEVDPYTLRHKKYPNVFGLGDVAGIPSSKTGAAIRIQAPILVHNLWQAFHGNLTKENQKEYDGYGSCPLVTEYGRVLLAEFDYSGKPTPSFPLNPLKERYSMWLLKRYLLPWMYWHLMLRGRA